MKHIEYALLGLTALVTLVTGAQLLQPNELQGRLSDQYRLCLQSVYDEYGDDRTVLLQDYLLRLRQATNAIILSSITDIEERDSGRDKVTVAVQSIRSRLYQEYNEDLDNLYDRFRKEEKDCAFGGL